MAFSVTLLAASMLLAAPLGSERARIVYVALGDSTAVGLGGGRGKGYPARLARRLEAKGISVDLVNLGENGVTGAELRRRQLPRLATLHPALVTIGVGLNDVIRGRDVRDFAADLEVIARAVERTGASVVVSTLPDLSRSPSGAGSPPSLATRFQAFNAAIRQVARLHGYEVAEVDLTSAAALQGSSDALFAGDGFHPSAKGYESWADAMWPAIARSLAALAPERRARRGR